MNELNERLLLAEELIRASTGSCEIRVRGKRGNGVGESDERRERRVEQRGGMWSDMGYDKFLLVENSPASFLSTHFNSNGSGLPQRVRSSGPRCSQAAELSCWPQDVDCGEEEYKEHGLCHALGFSGWHCWMHGMCHFRNAASNEAHSWLCAGTYLALTLFW